MERGTWGLHMTIRLDQIAVQRGESVHRVANEADEAVRSYPVGAQAGAGLIIFKKLPRRFVLSVGDPERSVAIERAKSDPHAGSSGFGYMRKNELEVIVNYHRI